MLFFPIDLPNSSFCKVKSISYVMLPPSLSFMKAITPRPHSLTTSSPSLPATQCALVILESGGPKLKFAKVALPLANWVTLNHIALAFSSA